MSIQVSATTEVLLKKRNITPNLILEIDGVDTIYTSLKTYKIARFGLTGLNFGLSGFNFGGLVADPNAETLISLGETGTTINQQLLQDKGGVSSVTSFAVELIDKDQQITRLITPGSVVDELLDRRAKLYVSFSGGSHPEDSMLIHSGVIDEISSGPVSVKINIASPESLKRQKLFIPIDTKLNGAINNSVTTITVDSTAGFLTQYGSEFQTYIKINEEIIKYTGLTSTAFTGCARGQLGTAPSSHSDNDSVASFYRINDNAINVALKLMISQSEEYYAQNAVTYLGAFDISNLNPRIIYFSSIDVKDKYGLVSGDTITIDGSASNDGDYTVVGFGVDESGSWIEIDQDLITELSGPAIAKFKSQFNVWPEGMGMTPYDVDVQGHIDINEKFFASIPVYDFYFKPDQDEINGKEFLSKEVYFPAGLYALPRKTKAGCQIVIPPVSTEGLKVLDASNVINPSSLRPTRSTTQNFYNAVVFKYEKLATDDKFVRGQIYYSADSQNRFKNQGNKPLVIESNGMRDIGDTDSIIRINARRQLDRYKFAAESLKGVKMHFKAGLQIEIGDVVLFGDEKFNLSDVLKGDRNFDVKAYEVINKSINLKNGEITAELLSTGFDLSSRYGGISPSTEIGIGSTTTEIVIIPTYGNTTFNQEITKWQNLIGQEIHLHNDDYSYSEITTLVSFSNTDNAVFNVSPAVSTAPSAGYFIDVAPYPTGTNSEERKLLKTIFSFVDEFATVTSGTSQTVFDVSLLDAAKLNVGLPIIIHNQDWSLTSAEVNVSNISGTTITVDSNLGFTPSNGQIIELIGFKDGGFPYVMV